MRHFHSLGFSIVAMAALIGKAPTALAGQTPSDMAEPPAYTAFVLAPSVAVTDFGFDSNILASSDDPGKDMTANLALHIAPSKQFGPASLRGNGAIGLAYFQEYANQRSANADGDLRLDVRLNRFTLYGSGSALRTRDSFGPEIDTRVRRTERMIEGGAEVRLSGKTWIGAGVNRSLIAFNASEVLFDSSLREALDRTVDAVSFGARTAVTPLTTVVGRVNLQYDRFAWYFRSR